MAFMARLRTAADESRLALRITFMSWLRPVRRKCKRAAAVSAVAAARGGRNGSFFTLALCQFRTLTLALRTLENKVTRGHWWGTRPRSPDRGPTNSRDSHGS